MDLSEGGLRAARGVLTLPLGSAADIAAVQRRTVSGVYARLRQLRAAGLVESVALGCLRPAVERFFMADDALSELGLGGATWHEPGNLIRLLERLTSVEVLYPAAASIRGLGELQDFQWVDDRSFDACARYELGWVVFFWVGMLRSEKSYAERLEAFGTDLQDLAVMDPSPRPSQLCCVVPDRWQLELVHRVVCRYQMEDWVRFWCISDDTWHGAEDCLPSRGWLHQPVYHRRAGHQAWDRRVRDSLWAADDGQDAARILYPVAQWPGITTTKVQLALREAPSGRRAQNGLHRLTDLGLLLRWRDGLENRYRLSPKGMRLLATMDRVSPESAWTRIQMDRWDKINGFEVHEYGLLDVMFQFVAAGCPVAAGWRDWEPMGWGGSIDPDGLVCLRRSPDGPGWHYLELERSARSPSSIGRKLHGYDSPYRVNDWPVLAACISDKAEQHFHAVGREMQIPMLTTTIKRFREHGAVNSEECWSRYGQPALIG